MTLDSIRNSCDVFETILETVFFVSPRLKLVSSVLPPRAPVMVTLIRDQFFAVFFTNFLDLFRRLFLSPRRISCSGTAGSCNGDPHARERFRNETNAIYCSFSTQPAV